ncbi:MAG TPA: hypothetical protein VF791_14825 [Pyrinomonadaceae bacterium]
MDIAEVRAEGSLHTCAQPAGKSLAAATLMPDGRLQAGGDRCLAARRDVADRTLHLQLFLVRRALNRRLLRTVGGARHLRGHTISFLLVLVARSAERQFGLHGRGAASLAEHRPDDLLRGAVSDRLLERQDVCGRERLRLRAQGLCEGVRGLSLRREFMRGAGRPFRRATDGGSFFALAGLTFAGHDFAPLP